MAGLVRGILVEHAGGPTGDPNRLVPDVELAAALSGRSDEQLRQAGADYAALWARTFPTLVRHLHGRPERTLALLCEEVVPFLRGDRLAARIESVGAGTAEVRLAPGIPDAWAAGLVEAFVGLSGARAEAAAAGPGLFRVRFTLPPGVRMAGLLAYLSSLRVPLVLGAALGAIAGTAVSAWAPSAGGVLDAWKVPVVAVGVVSAQAGANALHELRTPEGSGPLGPPRPSRAWWWWQLLGAYAVAAVAGVLLAWEAPAVLAFMGVGLLVGLLYPRFQAAGLGPPLAGFTYGPLVVVGTVHALAGAAAWELTPLALATSLPVGLLAAAGIYLDNLADRPLDEAGGKRTLLVRLPRARHAVGYAALVGLALAGLGALALWLRTGALLMLAPLALAALVLVQRVRAHLDDPRGLAPARFGTTVLHIGGVGFACFTVLWAAP